MAKKKYFVIIHDLDRLVESIWRRYGRKGFTALQFSRDYGVSEIGSVRVLNKMVKLGVLEKIGYRRYRLADKK